MHGAFLVLCMLTLQREWGGELNVHDSGRNSLIFTKTKYIYIYTHIFIMKTSQYKCII